MTTMMMMMMAPSKEDRPWSLEDVQRVLYHVVATYEQSVSPDYTYVRGSLKTEEKMPRRFIFFGKRLPFLGGDSELLRDAMRVAKETLKDNHWWPEEATS